MNKELNAAEAVYGFVGWLTTREERTVMSAKDDCAPIAELIKRFCTENNLPEVSDQWPLNLIHPSGEVAVPNAIYPSAFPGETTKETNMSTKHEQALHHLRAVLGFREGTTSYESAVAAMEKFLESEIRPTHQIHGLLP